MANNTSFDLQEKLIEWFENIKSESSVTESDAEELKNHLLDLIDELKKNGLNDEESFWVSSKRLGYSKEILDDYRDVNNPITQMRKSLLIFGGVLIYFLTYYFILFTSKLLFISLLHFNVDGYIAVNFVSRYLISFHFLLVIFLISIYFFEKRTVTWLEKIKFHPKQTLIFLFLAFLFGILDTNLFALAKGITGDDLILRNKLVHVYLYLNFSFPILIIIGFILNYFKYYNKTKILPNQ